ncbi:MAG: hypothetical protein WC577_00265 [Candidatus Paceibacterota bacterium]
MKTLKEKIDILLKEEITILLIFVELFLFFLGIIFAWNLQWVGTGVSFLLFAIFLALYYVYFYFNKS